MPVSPSLYASQRTMRSASYLYNNTRVRTTTTDDRVSRSVRDRQRVANNQRASNRRGGGGVVASNQRVVAWDINSVTVVKWAWSDSEQGVEQL